MTLASIQYISGMMQLFTETFEDRGDHKGAKPDPEEGLQSQSGISVRLAGLHATTRMPLPAGSTGNSDYGIQGNREGKYGKT